MFNSALVLFIQEKYIFRYRTHIFKPQYKLQEILQECSNVKTHGKEGKTCIHEDIQYVLNSVNIYKFSVQKSVYFFSLSI